MVEHTVKAFDDEIGALRGLIAEMGGLAEVAIAQSVEALVRRDNDLAAQVIANDARLDALEVEVDRLAVRIIALRAPMADDLRDVISALKISGIIERIGDYAKNIAKRVGDVDEFYNSIFRNLVAHMMENPATISSAAQLLFVARNLERIGDHATNVAELVYYAATGEYYADRDMPRGS